MKKLAILLTAIVVLLISACSDPGETLQPNEEKKEPRIATAAEVEQAVALVGQANDVTQQIYTPKTKKTRAIYSETFTPPNGSGSISYNMYIDETGEKPSQIVMEGSIIMDTGTQELGVIGMDVNMTTIIQISGEITNPDNPLIFTLSYKGFVKFTMKDVTEKIEYKNFSIDFTNKVVKGEILYTLSTGETVRVTEEQLQEAWVFL